MERPKHIDIRQARRLDHRTHTEQAPEPRPAQPTPPEQTEQPLAPQVIARSRRANWRADEYQKRAKEKPTADNTTIVPETAETAEPDRMPEKPDAPEKPVPQFKFQPRTEARPLIDARAGVSLHRMPGLQRPPTLTPRDTEPTGDVIMRRALGAVLTSWLAPQDDAEPMSEADFDACVDVALRHFNKERTDDKANASFVAAKTLEDWSRPANPAMRAVKYKTLEKALSLRPDLISYTRYAREALADLPWSQPSSEAVNTLFRDEGIGARKLVLAHGPAHKDAALAHYAPALQILAHLDAFKPLLSSMPPSETGQRVFIDAMTELVISFADHFKASPALVRDLNTLYQAIDGFKAAHPGQATADFAEAIGNKLLSTVLLRIWLPVWTTHAATLNNVERRALAMVNSAFLKLINLAPCQPGQTLTQDMADQVNALLPVMAAFQDEARLVILDQAQSADSVESPR